MSRAHRGPGLSPHSPAVPLHSMKFTPHIPRLGSFSTFLEMPSYVLFSLALSTSMQSSPRINSNQISLSSFLALPPPPYSALSLWEASLYHWLHPCATDILMPTSWGTCACRPGFFNPKFPEVRKYLLLEAPSIGVLDRPAPPRQLYLFSSLPLILICYLETALFVLAVQQLFLFFFIKF